jgi:hypothetical protein
LKKIEPLLVERFFLCPLLILGYLYVYMKIILTESQYSKMVSSLDEGPKGSSRFTPEYLEKIKEKYKGKLLKDFDKGEDRDVYVYVVRQGPEFYKEFTKDMLKSKTSTPTKYTPENLEKIKEKYKGKTLMDFKNGDPGAYQAVYKLGKDFFSDFIKDMVKARRPDYTEDELRDIAKKYYGEYLIDFRNNEPSAYSAVIKRGKEFYHDLVKDMVKSQRLKYTEDELRDIAKKYKTREEFRRFGKGAIKASIKKGPFITNPITGNVKNTYGFYNDITSHMVDKKDASKRLVYVYKFYDENNKPVAAYVGLTFDAEVRKKEHLQGIKRNGREGLTPVTKYIMDHPTYEYEYKELTDYIDANMASKMEKHWENKYFMDGLEILNVAPTGSLGGYYRMSHKEIKKKLDYLYDVIGIKTLDDLRKNYGNLYQLIYNRGLHKLENGNFLSKFGKGRKSENEVFNLAIQYDTYLDFVKNKKLYGSAIHRKLLPKIKEYFAKK